ncbi:MAG TPA: YdeI/OmpD-associated family protein [Acidimicrobiales bacterium]|nr:YdeI/OmpD-associated family protein [Acidimicrobiales bacterium]
MDALDGVEVTAFPDPAAWESWLAANHQLQAGVWLKLAKKSSGIPSVTDDEVVDIGLCYGWVSGQRKALDEGYYLQKYVPRRPRSLWSQVNVDKVEKLLAAGRMREPGMAEVRAAQADGRWDAAYASQKEATVPPDVVTALEENAKARAVFDALDRTAQYRLYLPVLQALSPKARVARLQKLIAQLEAGAAPATSATRTPGSR